ncbi:MAG: DUF6600 domain-containing protein, partial [Pseudomonadota bacterium]
MNPKHKLSLLALVGAMAAGSTGCGVHYSSSAYAGPAFAGAPAARIGTTNTRARLVSALSPHGRWVVSGEFGRVWSPYDMTADWRPYTNGYWVERDAEWVWHSNFSWGWAAFHYGRWNLDPNFGWVWVPDDVWAPAWVVWRTGGDVIGWAPAPVGYTVYGSSWVTGVPASSWCFVPRRYAIQRHWYRHRVARRYNDHHVRHARAARSPRDYYARGRPAGNGARGTPARRGRAAGYPDTGPVVGHSSGRGSAAGRPANGANAGRGRAAGGVIPGSGPRVSSRDGYSVRERGGQIPQGGSPRATAAREQRTINPNGRTLNERGNLVPRSREPNLTSRTPQENFTPRT